MSLQEIEKAIVQLPPTELTQLADWFAEYQAQERDRKIERDAKAGRLEALAQKANAEFHAGRYTIAAQFIGRLPRPVRCSTPLTTSPQRVTANPLWFESPSRESEANRFLVRHSVAYKAVDTQKAHSSSALR